jgi:hypothetical protein
MPEEEMMKRYVELASLVWHASITGIEQAHAVDYIVGLGSHPTILARVGSFLGSPHGVLFIMILFIFLVMVIMKLLRRPTTRRRRQARKPPARRRIRVWVRIPRWLGIAVAASSRRSKKAPVRRPPQSRT